MLRALYKVFDDLRKNFRERIEHVKLSKKV